MEIDFKNCSEEELWKFVASYLKSRNIDTILVGGAVVSIYSDGAYESGDLDLVFTNMFVKNVPEVMQEIGFHRSGRHFVHPECTHLYIEFPKGPVEIGNDFQIVPDEHEVNGQKIKILSPTDCVKDRLATYIYYNDRVGLEQAVLVAKKHPIQFEKVKNWCSQENAISVFEEFSNLMRPKN